uniref:Uncharacterized protein n=1 Tax=Alexandrium catenella TaxID=2925 RepID=A0A7S1S4I9_ALECA
MAARVSAAQVRAGSAAGLRGSRPSGVDASRRTHSQSVIAREGRGDAGARSLKPAWRPREAAQKPTDQQRREERRPSKIVMRIHEADIRLAQQLQDEELGISAAEVAANLEAARRLQAEEEQDKDAEAAQEDADAALARILHREQERQHQAAKRDGALAAALQYEHGRAGRMLTRACELEEFLEAPLGSLPLPKHGDMHPDTLRMVVLRTQKAPRWKGHLPAAALAAAPAAAEVCPGKAETLVSTPKQRSPLGAQEELFHSKPRFRVTGSLAVGCREV